MTVADTFQVIPLCSYGTSAHGMLPSGPAEWEDRYGGEPRKGADILVQALEREGVGRIFAYPGGASMEIHQALTRSPTIRNILCRHEQVLAADHGSSPASRLIGEQGVRALNRFAGCLLYRSGIVTHQGVIGDCRERSLLLRDMAR